MDAASLALTNSKSNLPLVDGKEIVILKVEESMEEEGSVREGRASTLQSVTDAAAPKDELRSLNN